MIEEEEEEEEGVLECTVDLESLFYINDYKNVILDLLDFDI